MIILGLGSENVTNAMDGRINGDGTVNVSGANFSNQGTIAAEEGGFATRLNIEGDVVNTGSATIDVRMAGAAQGSQFGHLEVKGGVTLGGDLDVMLQSSFIPANGDFFEIITTTDGGLVSGTFTNTPGNVYSFGAGAFDVTYNATSVVLSNFNAVPEPSSLVMSVLGLLCVLAHRKRPY